LRACDVFRIGPEELMKSLYAPDVMPTHEEAYAPLVRKRKPRGTFIH